MPSIAVRDGSNSLWHGAVGVYVKSLSGLIRSVLAGLIRAQQVIKKTARCDRQAINILDTYHELPGSPFVR